MNFEQFGTSGTGQFGRGSVAGRSRMRGSVVMHRSIGMIRGGHGAKVTLCGMS